MVFPSSKNLLYLIIPAFFLFTTVSAQKDNRTLDTQIADVSAQFPAEDSIQFSNLMKQMEAFGKPGILRMTQMLRPPGEGDNSKLEYALGGFSYYVTSKNKEKIRLTTSNAYVEALSAASDEDIQAFIIRQLQAVGKDEAVTGLEPYLQNPRLCGPAARALVSINTASSRNALLSALPSAKTCQYALMEALGDVRHAAAISSLSQLAESTDPTTKRLALYGLANIGDPSSEKLLATEAREANYVLNETNATASYLLWARRMAEAGNIKPVEKLTKNLLKKLDDDEQVNTRTAFLKLWADTREKTAMPALLSAAIDKNPEYRAAALQFAEALQGNDITSMWVGQMKKAGPAAKADILHMLGNRNDKTAYNAVASGLENENPMVRRAAIFASVKLGQDMALPRLLEMMKTTSDEEVDAIKTGLLTMKGEQVVPAIAEALSQVPPYSKAALLEVLGTRKASSQSNKVIALAEAPEPIVRLAALKALENMATYEDTPALYPLLINAENEEEISSLQTAIIHALKTQDKAVATDLILKQMAAAPQDKGQRYYPIIASLGSEKGLSALTDAFAKGNKEDKDAAISALSNWNDIAGGRALLRIGKNTSVFDQALEGVVHQVSLSSGTPVNKYLLLRDAMEVARNPEQKKKIIKEMGNNSTFPSLLYVGSFLDDDMLKQEAAQAVIQIALANREFYGDDVRELLNKSMNLLEGQESAYLKEAVRKHLEALPAEAGYTNLFNGKDLTGWKGLVGNPIKRASMNAKILAKEQKKADDIMLKGWTVEDGKLIFTGEGANISTEKKYGDFEMFVDWKISKDGDAGIYLRGTPQVQIWDTTRHEVGAQVGSGGLYNNQTHESKPLVVADNPIGEWNNFHILMEGERVTVYLNGVLVVDHVIMENYWDRSQAIVPEDYIELQAHGTRVEYRDIYLKEIPRPEPFQLSEEESESGFTILFDGTDMHHFSGNTHDYMVEKGHIVIYPERGGKGNLFTKKEYSDFIFRFEFQLTPGANNGLGIRAPLEGDAAYVGMELQILDNTADIYKNLQPYQYHGSVYGVIPAERGYLKPVGEWNYQEVDVRGSKVKVTLNGHVILEGDISEASKNGTMDGKDHPGLKRDAGHIGFLGHGSVVRFRNIRVNALGK